MKGLIFISNVQKALEYEWFADALVSTDLKMDFILFNAKDSELYNYLKGKGLKCTNYNLPSKYFIPFYIFFFWLKFLFKKYDLVHCHLLEASLIGIGASKMAGIKKRIYTRHHSDFHHTYFPHAIKYDLWINRRATHIIAVSDVVKQILINKEGVEEKKITTIPHGIPKNILQKTISSNAIAKMKDKYQLKDSFPLVGVVSRFTYWKGVQYIIPAFKNLLNKFPNANLVLAGANGNYETEIHKALKELPSSSYKLIAFENEMPALFSAFDIFVHTPIDNECEAFGQVYIESMAYGVPMVCTLSGIANVLVKDKQNAIVVPYKDNESIYNAMIELLSNDELKKSLIQNGKKDILKFTFEEKFEQTLKVYLN